MSEPMTINEAADHLRTVITENSQWGPDLSALHLHELARMRRFWPSPVRHSEVVIFASMLHKFVSQEHITRDDMREILITMHVHLPDIEQLMKPEIIYHYLQRIFTEGSPEVERATSQLTRNRKERRQQQKKSRRANRG